MNLGRNLISQLRGGIMGETRNGRTVDGVGRTNGMIPSLPRAEI
jgi:hypothetical protein